MRRLNKDMEVQSQVSDSTFAVDIDRMSNDGKKLDNEGKRRFEKLKHHFFIQDSPSLHGKSVIAEESPMLTICDYQKGLISEQSTFKLKVHKPKERLFRVFIGEFRLSFYIQ